MLRLLRGLLWRAAVKTGLDHRAKQVGLTVRVRRGAFAGRRGRVASTNTAIYVMIRFSPELDPIAIPWADLEPEL